MSRQDPPELRPIGARALKSAIDSLRPYLPGARVLDLFSGQGRFGLAALDEQAEHVIFVEKNRGTAQSLSRSLGNEASRAEVRPIDAFAFLARDEGRYDIIFADPPFPLWSPDFSRTLFTAVAPRLANDSIFLVKHPTRVIASDPIPGFRFWKETDFGESKLLYYSYGQKAP